MEFIQIRLPRSESALDEVVCHLFQVYTPVCLPSITTWIPLHGRQLLLEWYPCNTHQTGASKLSLGAKFIASILCDWVTSAASLLEHIASLDQRLWWSSIR